MATSIQIRLQEDEITWLDSEAESAFATRSSVIRRLIRDARILGAPRLTVDLGEGISTSGFADETFRGISAEIPRDPLPVHPNGPKPPKKIASKPPVAKEGSTRLPPSTGKFCRHPLSRRLPDGSCGMCGEKP